MPLSRSAQRFVSIDEFAAEQNGGIRSAGLADDLDNSSGRLISYRLSDPSVARDNHVILANAWQLGNFLRNPVMPWAHDTSAPPIAKWVDIVTRGDLLIGTAEYADRDTYPFADTIFRLVKGGFLNAVSTSWLPIEWKFSTDRSRPGGIDFLKVDLLEVSQVPVPALPTALVTARAQGIDTGPIVEWAERLLDSNDFAVLPRTDLETLRREAKMPTPAPRKFSPNWKVGTSRSLPIDQTSPFDAAAAAESVFAHCGFDGANPNTALARKAFLIHDAANPKSRESYQLPIAKIVDGRLTAIAAGVRSAMFQPLPDYASTFAILGSVREVVETYAAKFEKPPAPALVGKRSLYHVGYLASLLNELGYLQDCVAYEAALEEDGSQVPAELMAALKQLGQVLLAMTEEEVAELLGGDEEDAIGNVDVIEMSSPAGVKRSSVVGLLHELDAGALAAVAAAMRHHLQGRKVVFSIDGDTPVPVTRAGRVLSADNERCLRDAHDHITRGLDMVRSVTDQCNDDGDDSDDEDPSDQDDDDNKRAIRLRRAKAMKLRIANPTG